LRTLLLALPQGPANRIRSIDHANSDQPTNERLRDVSLTRVIGTTVGPVGEAFDIVRSGYDRRAELTKLRRENNKLKVEREILKKAAAFNA